MFDALHTLRDTAQSLAATCLLAFGWFLLGIILGVWLDGWGRRKTIQLKLSAVTYHPKSDLIMSTALKSSVNQFAQVTLAPVDADGKPVKLDSDAIVAEVISGPDGARTAVQVLDDDAGGRRFLVHLIPGSSPGKTNFRIRGDAEPGEGVVILEEEFEYETTPNNAVSLGVTVQLLPKSSLPA